MRPPIKDRSLRLLLYQWPALLALAIAPALPAKAAPTPVASPTIYMLNQQSTYQQGCFPPCLCPVLQAAGVRGTFVLTLTTVGPQFTTYAISDVNWIVSLGSEELPVSGSGTFEVGGEFAAEQRLQLDLTVGKQPVEHFDSGFVTPAARFPDIAATISIHGQRCFDTVFGVNASPVPFAQIHPYRLLFGSTVQRGCFPPCACALGPRLPLSGGFALVDLPPTPSFQEFAVVDVSWLAAALTAGKPLTLHGSGFYRLRVIAPLEHQMPALGVQQQLTLELTVGDQLPVQFDSGLVPGGASFPRIGAKISINGARCADTVIVLKASQ